MTPCLDIAELVRITATLRRQFAATAPQPWTALTAGAELAVQVGHLAQCLLRQIDSAAARSVAEEGRDIANMADEIADVLLQVCGVLLLRDQQLAGRLHAPAGIEKCPPVVNLLTIVAAAGQIIEEQLVAEGFRHARRQGDAHAWTLDRSQRILDHCARLAQTCGIGLDDALATMNREAQRFVQTFR